MKKMIRNTFSLFLALVMLFSLVATAFAVTPPANTVFEKRTGSASGSIAGLKYYVYSPKKSPSDTTKYPVMIWMHGAGAGGTTDYAVLNSSDVKNFASAEYQSFFPEGGFYIVAPQNPESAGGYPNSWMTTDSAGRSVFLGAVNNIIDYVLANDQVDLNRVYIGGYSMGGFMTWQLAINRPSLYAAAFPICPAYKPTDTELSTLSNLPIWIFAGRQDPVVGYSTYIQGVKEKLESFGNTKVRQTIFETVLNPDKTMAPSQHHSWVPVTFNLKYNDGTQYDPNYSGTFLDWLKAQTKGSSPTKAASPTASPAAGTYTTTQSVTLSSATSGASIYYTTNGSTPTTSSNLYSTPITVSTTSTIKAIAVKSGMTNSDVASFAYTINPNNPITIKVEAETATTTGTPNVGSTFVESYASASGGKLLGFMSRVGNTATWTVNVTSAGTYKLVLRLAGTGSAVTLASQMSFTVDNSAVTLSGTLNAANGNYYNFADYGPFSINLTAGNHTFKMTSLGTSVPNFDYFTLTK